MRYIFISLLWCSIMISPVLGQSGRTLVNEGNKLFDQEQYDQALSNYKEALEKQTPEDIIRYNLGNVYYRKDNYDLAEQELESAIESDDPEMQVRGYFNRGNARFKQQQFDKSIEDYIEVLKRHPEDMGAKVNLELSRRMLQYQQQQEQEQCDNDSSGQDQEQKKQQQSQQDQEQKEQQQEQQSQESEQQEQEEQQQQMAQAQEEELTQEEAEKLLNALQNDEKAVLQELIKRQMPAQQPTGNDW